MKKNMLFSMMLFGLAGAVYSLAEKETSAWLDMAESEARTWVELVDAGRYQEAWHRTAEAFKVSTRGRRQWIETMESARPRLGKTLSRELHRRRYTNALPSLPEGHYILVEYRTAFEEKKAALERVSTMREADGAWRVSAYMIR